MQQFFPTSRRPTSRPSRRGQTLSAIVAALAVILMAAPARADKLRDLCDVLGARDNQLVGYGVVTGLNGTGDDIMVPYAAQSLRSLMRRLGIQVDSSQVRLRNVAAVIVTATLPAFVRPGSRIDVTVSSMGNAKSLRGGVLIQTPLRGADRKTYAVGQGSLVVGGFSAAGFNGSYLQQNVTTTGRVPTGALVEREIKANFENKGKLTLALRIPDFGTASRVVEALEKSLGKGSASALDGGAIEVTSDPKESPVEMCTCPPSRLHKAASVSPCKKPAMSASQARSRLLAKPKSFRTATCRPMRRARRRSPTSRARQPWLTWRKRSPRLASRHATWRVSCKR
jgi:flagellar P-ring protein precursor FlgI